MTISFFVFGEPKAQPRARAFALRGRGGKVILSKSGQPIIRVHEAGTAENWKSQVALAAKEHCPPVPIDGPISVNLDFCFPRPKAHFRTGKHANELRPDAPTWHTSKPDRDNCEKAVTDALKVLGMFKDDSQICYGAITKCYGRQPGCQIKIETLDEPKVASVIQPTQPELI